MNTPRTIFFCVKCHKVIEDAVFIQVVGLTGLMFHEQCFVETQNEKPNDLDDHWTLD